VALLGVSILTDANTSLTWANFKVTMGTGGGGSLVQNSLLQQPFTWWSGKPIQSAVALSTIVQKTRCIASSLLLTDVSNLFVAGGVNYTKINATGCYPAEAGINGIVSAPTAKAHPTRESNGVYSAPYKFGGAGENEFKEITDDWKGRAPHTVMYGYLTAANNSNQPAPTMNLVACDIFEFKMQQVDQTQPTMTVPLDAFIMRELDALFADNNFICENPNHIAFIKSWLGRLGKFARNNQDTITTLASAANPKLGMAARAAYAGANMFL